MWFDVPHMAHLHEAVKAKRLQLMTEAESWRMARAEPAPGRPRRLLDLLRRLARPWSPSALEVKGGS